MALDTAKAVTGLRGLTAKFDNAVKAASPFYPRLATTVPSKGADERYGMLGSVPQVREWLGDRDFKELRAADWTLVNRKWEISLSIEQDDIADDRLGMYGPTLAQLGTRASKHPDKLLFELINGAESALCFDGQFFFDTDHVWGDSGSQDNDLGATAATGTTPTVAEFKLAYNAALAAMMAFVDDQNELINDDIFDEAQQVTVVVPPTMLQTAHDALSVMLSAAGGDNWVLARPTIIASARFTSAAKFDIYKTDEPIKPYIFQAREPITRQMKGSDDMEFKNVKFMTKARYNVGYGAWWTAVRTTFT